MAEPSFTDAELLRYSRQILLGPVGGRGQRALNAARVQVCGRSPAALVAQGYLGAAGSQVSWEDPAPGAGVFGPPPRPRAAGAPGGLLADAPFPGPWGAPSVVLGAWEADGAVMFLGPGGCEGCFAAVVSTLAAPPPGAAAVLLGALAALTFQRLVLGLGERLGGIRVMTDGTFLPIRLAACTHLS